MPSMHTLTTRSLLASLLGLLLVCGTSSQVQAIDTVRKKSEDRQVAGEITKVSRTEVVVHQRVGNQDVTVPANDIARVDWTDQPPALGLARSNEGSGNLQEALAGYQEALGAVPSGAANMKADVEFLLARTSAKIAQQDSSQLPAALEKLKGYVNTHRDFFRYYEAQMLLAETALVAEDYSTATSAFTLLEDAPWQDYKMAGQLGNARTALAQNNLSEAKSIFDQVAGVDPSNDFEKARQLEAMLGQAQCLQRESNYNEATQILEEVISRTGPDDTRLLAEAYIQLGDCFSADGQKIKEALLAYLHVDVIPSLAKHSDLHARALFNLAKLWPAAGQPGRAAEASAKLEQDYPNSEWTQKLGSG
jgi:tetratricopeptide (TPR) repeat protein